MAVEAALTCELWDDRSRQQRWQGRVENWTSDHAEPGVRQQRNGNWDLFALIVMVLVSHWVLWCSTKSSAFSIIQYFSSTVETAMYYLRRGSPGTMLKLSSVHCLSSRERQNRSVSTNFEWQTTCLRSPWRCAATSDINCWGRICKRELPLSPVSNLIQINGEVLKSCRSGGSYLNAAIQVTGVCRKYIICLSVQLQRSYALRAIMHWIGTVWCTRMATHCYSQESSTSIWSWDSKGLSYSTFPASRSFEPELIVEPYMNCCTVIKRLLDLFIMIRITFWHCAVNVLVIGPFIPNIKAKDSQGIYDDIVRSESTYRW